MTQPPRDWFEGACDQCFYRGWVWQFLQVQTGELQDLCPQCYITAYDLTLDYP